MATPLLSSSTDIALKGEITVAGDKSISHRSLIFSALANGRSTISGLLEGEDVFKTAEALRKMGAEIERKENNVWQVNGVGYCGLQEPNDILDMGNSGTSTRLLMGLVSPFKFTTFFTGDASLRKRPMKRVFDPIRQIGAQVVARNDQLLPAAIIGTDEAMAINYEMKVASAQVKSAIMLAALNILGTTTIIEPEKCRDHTEIMMQYLGLDVKVEDHKNGRKISVNGCNDFAAKDFTIPGDISSAAFMIVAALIIPGSKIRINNVGVNPLRDGIITTLKEMGGNIELVNQRLVGGEKVADILVEYSDLKAVEVPAHRAPSMIDEYPILAIAASFAKGTTKMNGLEELKVKESNRLQAILDGLKLCGVEAKAGDDYLEVTGGPKEQKEIAKITTHLDHRIAMSFLIMGLRIKGGVKIDDSEMIKTSFPNFVKIFAGFGVDFKSA
ncbi:MAG: 5-enolpyruvylshikimate-3-phosphate synthase [Rickettsiaceae bacterium]|jgi:3-phosphoshikimate 1-carboxyvinyltransferase|nr:5-enolpyruvylshikimate-3-phosphate synthase [Rickettsiaceae bacterium]